MKNVSGSVSADISRIVDTIEIDNEEPSIGVTEILELNQGLVLSRHKPKSRPFKNPAWFLDLELACFKCKCRCNQRNISQHFKHSDGSVELESAPLFRDYHLTMWANLYNKVIVVIMRKLSLTSRKGLIDYLKNHKLANGLPRFTKLSFVNTQAANRYYDQFGGVTQPDSVTVNPPNSVLSLTNRDLFDKLLQFNPEVNSAIYKALKHI